MHGILPLKVILLKRHIGTSGVCPLCQSDEEDILYMVFNVQELQIFGEYLVLRIQLIRLW
jgi:hypothetical protein